jgi:DivIVA domain-containing protein
MPRLSADDVASRNFATSFRGYAEAEVRSFLKRVADDLAAAREREHELVGAIDELEARLASPRPLDEKELLDALGEETARLLRNAREAAEDIRQKSEERAARIVEEAQADAQRLRHEAAEILAVRTREAEDAASEVQRQVDERVTAMRADAERLAEELHLRAQQEADAIVEAARTQGREMVEEAKALRERVLNDLARRRGLLQAQLEALRNGRDHLLEAYRVVKRTFLEATESLAQAEARAAEGKPLPSVDPSDVEAAIAVETQAETDAVAGGDVDASAGAAPVSDQQAAVAAPEAGGEAAPVTGDDATVALEVVEAPPVAELPEVDDAPAQPQALADVDSLFARIRASASEAPSGTTEAPAAEAAAVADVATHAPETPEPAPVAAVPTPVPQPVTEPEPAPEVDPRAQWRETQAVVVQPLVTPLVRQAKRNAQDEQNALLDALRRFKGRPTAEQLLQSERDSITAWAGVLRSGLDTAYGAGREAVGGEAVSAPPDLVDETVLHVIGPLRERLGAAVDDANDGYSTSLVIERIGARYREWKLQSLEGMVGDALAVAWSRGVFDAVPDATLLQWIPAEEGRCADCDDNGLEPTVKGEAFPTGQLHPPAHPGCRCLLVPADASA